MMTHVACRQSMMSTYHYVYMYAYLDYIVFMTLLSIQQQHPRPSFNDDRNNTIIINPDDDFTTYIIFFRW